jgi:hypothetical protein
LGRMATADSRLCVPRMCAEMQVDRMPNWSSLAEIDIVLNQVNTNALYRHNK